MTYLPSFRDKAYVRVLGPLAQLVRAISIPLRSLKVSVLSLPGLFKCLNFKLVACFYHSFWGGGNTLQPLDVFTILKIITKKTHDKVNRTYKGIRLSYRLL